MRIHMLLINLDVTDASDIQRILRSFLAFLHGNKHILQRQHQKPDWNGKTSILAWRAAPAQSYSRQCTV